MHSVTDEEVDFILSDIEARGVVLEDLQYNLLDHMCCIIENEMPESGNFYKFYEYTSPFFQQRIERTARGSRYFVKIQKLLRHEKNT